MDYPKNKKLILIQLSVVFLVGLVLFYFHDIRQSLDHEIKTLFVKTRGELSPDTNIVLIHFSSEDIARIGPWPIKRNYYALLINQLSNLGVKKIGLEIFLSSRLVTQSVYDNLLRKEIEKSGKVILSSISGRIMERNDIYYTDSLSFPSPKLLNEELSTGHINYIRDFDYKIPLELIDDGIHEKAFSLQLSGLKTTKKSSIVNFVSSWGKIKKYSALEFARLVYNKNSELKYFKNKIVIIGISDPQVATTFQTPFDEQLPGIAFHAFALDNLLNHRDISADFYNSSIIFFLLVVFGFIFYRNASDKKIILKYVVIISFLLVLSFTLIAFLNLKISSSFFLIPFIILIITDMIITSLQGREELKGAIDEAVVLRNLLISKEMELEKLQKELSESGEESVQLVEKIESLRSDIEKLKENEDDRSEAQFKTNIEVKEFYGIIYTSNLMEQVVELIKKAAPTETTILIMGESGTGKELVAKAIHSLSKRKDNNFIAVNCGALTDSLLESELFGYMRGAFTGAVADKQGRFEMANNGTIFLDEIGETSENFQVKMLRVLQSGEIEKVGATKTEKVNVRVVAATNKDVATLVKEKNFREDLYYRLNVITIELPPLRERKEDIDPLAKSFLQSEVEDMQISKAALQALNDYQWKGNVRELESVIKRAVIFARSDRRKLLRLSDLPKELVKETSLSFEDIVIDSLRNKNFSHSSITETAKELGNLNRTVISENLRGMVLKTLIENDFNFEKTVSLITGLDDNEARNRVRSKTQTFVRNIENDLKRIHNDNFEDIKKHLTAKYKNLPAKFHQYLDEYIRWKIKDGVK